ncbi:MAG: hypothetical protein JO282_05635 [Alphaproteobacteria bacterium]|nr:hypothetical protein [Alphaproteobacteria bacterium]
MHEIVADLPDGQLDRRDLDEVKRRFAATYTRLYAPSLCRNDDRGTELAGPGLGATPAAFAGQRAGGEQSRDPAGPQ